MIQLIDLLSVVLGGVLMLNYQLIAYTIYCNQLLLKINLVVSGLVRLCESESLGVGAARTKAVESWCSFSIQFFNHLIELLLLA